MSPRPGLDELQAPRSRSSVEGWGCAPWLFNDRSCTLGYTFLVPNSSPAATRPSRSERWTIDLNHQVASVSPPEGGPGAPRRTEHARTSGSVSQSVHGVRAVTRDRWGRVGFRALVSEISRSATPPECRSYLQRTLGRIGTSTVQRARASYDGYRFRGPTHDPFFQESIGTCAIGVRSAALRCCSEQWATWRAQRAGSELQRNTA
jgi:hypothetical protein